MFFFIALLFFNSLVGRNNENFVFYHRAKNHDLISMYIPRDCSPFVERNRTGDAMTIQLPGFALNPEGITTIKTQVQELSQLSCTIQATPAFTALNFSWSPLLYNITILKDKALGRFSTIMIVIERKNDQSPKDYEFQPPQTILIDPGHGGKDHGTYGYGGQYTEKALALQAAGILAKELATYGFKTEFTRTKDIAVTLGERTAHANGIRQPTLLVSLHGNAMPPDHNNKTGFEIHYPSFAKSEQLFPELSGNFLKLEKKRTLTSKRCAQLVKESMKKAVGIKQPANGVFPTLTQVLAGCHCPAILIELGYISHPEEGPLLSDEQFIAQQMRGIARGIHEFARSFS